MTDKRYPRTLQEAFGPYTTPQIEGAKPRDPLWVRAFYWVIAVLAIGCMLSQLSGCSAEVNAGAQFRRFIQDCKTNSIKYSAQVNDDSGKSHFTATCTFEP